MKIQWTIVLISALTDFMIVMGGCLSGAMIAVGTTVMPSQAVFLLGFILGAVAAARTIQQALKITPDISAALVGAPSITSTSTVTSSGLTPAKPVQTSAVVIPGPAIAAIPAVPIAAL